MIYTRDARLYVPTQSSTPRVVGFLHGHLQGAQVQPTPGFSYNPVSPTPPPAPIPPTPQAANLGLLAPLVGQWVGSGFNAIWRPSSQTQDRFLELNETHETLTFTAIGGSVPNRGLLQADLFMAGLHYLQEITDANQDNAGLHVEPGVWLNIPSTSNPLVQATVARLASIPHGVTINAQGTAFVVSGPPVIGTTNLNPFPVGNPAGATKFQEQDLKVATAFRTEDAFLTNITQVMVDDPNSVLNASLTTPPVATTVLQVTSADVPILGGGTAETAFLKGGPGGPNAHVDSVTATFWIETLPGNASLQLQYTQTVILNFNGLSWPHVSVATLTKAP